MTISGKYLAHEPSGISLTIAQDLERMAATPSSASQDAQMSDDEVAHLAIQARTRQRRRAIALADPQLAAQPRTLLQRKDSATGGVKLSKHVTQRARCKGMLTQDQTYQAVRESREASIKGKRDLFVAEQLRLREALPLEDRMKYPLSPLMENYVREFGFPEPVLSLAHPIFQKPKLVRKILHRQLPSSISRVALAPPTQASDFYDHFSEDDLDDPDFALFFQNLSASAERETLRAGMNFRNTPMLQAPSSSDAPPVMALDGQDDREPPKSSHTDSYIETQLTDSMNSVRISGNPEPPRTGLEQPKRRPARAPPPVPVPCPTASYLEQASTSTCLGSPQPLLIIADLNGTLIIRSRTNSQKRPGLFHFLSYIMNLSHETTFAGPASQLGHLNFMIWTSARPENAARALISAFSPEQQTRITAVWARNTLRLTPQQYSSKLQVYKNLEWVWQDEQIQRTHPYYAHGGRWTQRNTVLIDDSTEKARSQPHNLIHVPSLNGGTLAREELHAMQAAGQDCAAVSDKRGLTAEARKQAAAEKAEILRNDRSGVLGRVAWYIEKLRREENVSAYMREHPFHYSNDMGEDKDENAESRSGGELEGGGVALPQRS